MMSIFCALHADHSSHSGLSELLVDKLGRFGEFLDEVIIHGFIDTLKLVLFLFLTYLLMEFIEHKASDKLKCTMTRAGKFGPLIGGEDYPTDFSGSFCCRRDTRRAGACSRRLRVYVR